MMRKVLLRADGGTEMGLGHIVRCCALAGMLKDYFECHFLVRAPSPAMKDLILQSCTGISELSAGVPYNEEARLWTSSLSGDEIVVLDGYYFDTAYQQEIRSKGCKLVCIDDIHSYHFIADVIINHAGGINASDYSAETYTKYCLGLKYALIRKEFLDAAPSKTQVSADPNSIFLCLGGADPNNVTLEILKYLSAINPQYYFEVIVGAAYRFGDSLRAFAMESRLRINIHSSLNASDILALMRRCGIAICPPSTVSIEYLAVNNGLLFLKKIAENQATFYKYLVNGNFAFDISAFEQKLLNGRQKTDLTDLDGLQKARLLEIFNNLQYAN